MPPPDIAVALRSLSRRWRQLFAATDEGLDDSDIADLAGRRPNADSPSALEHLVGVVSALELAAADIRSMRATDQPDLSGPGPVESGAGHAGLDQSLEALDEAVQAAARQVEAVPASDWGRTGQRDGRPVDLLTRAREAVRDGVEHLRAAEAALRQARAQPD